MRDNEGRPRTRAADTNDTNDDQHTKEARAIAGAYASKSALLAALGLQRRSRMTAGEIQRICLFHAMTDRHFRQVAA
jgi:hypothetical protein